MSAAEEEPTVGGGEVAADAGTDVERRLERRLDRRAGWIIALAAVLAYCCSLGGDFVYDDLHSVRDNPGVWSLANIPRFFTDVSLFSGNDCRLYRPVLLTTFAIDGFIGGMHPWPFKLTNLLLHLCAAVLLFGIARQLGLRRSPALIGAVLFAVHPMASEAVNTVSGRSNVLTVVALLAAVRLHFAAMRGRISCIVGTAAFGLVAVGCKEPGMILPVLLAILEGLRIAGDPGAPRDYRRIVARLLPSVLIVVGYVFLRAHMLGASSFGVGEWSGSDPSSGHGRGLQTHLASMIAWLPQTLLQVVVPHGITMDPPVRFVSELLSPAVIGSAVLMLLLTGLGLRAPRRRPLLFLGTCLAWGNALPWILKPLNLPFLEHRYYGVLAGLALVVAGLIRVPDWRSLPAASRGALCAAVAVLALMSATRCLEFGGEEELWTIELHRNPESRVAMAGMAVVRIQQGRYAEARPYLIRLVDAYPNRRDPRLNLAEAALHTGDAELALQQSRFLTTTWPLSPFHWLLHSRALAAMGVQTREDHWFDAAVEAALHCLEVAEPKALVFRTAASARRQQGDLAAAVGLLDRSVERGLDHESVLLDRSALLEQLGRYREARRDLLQVLVRAPHPDLLARLDRLDRMARNPSARPK